MQLFDSWSGSLAPSEFERWVIAPTARIVSKLRALRPELTIIGFPKGAGGKLPAYARETGVDALGLDETVDPVWAHAILSANMPAIPHQRLMTLVIVLIGFGTALNRIGIGSAGVGELLLLLGTAAAAIGAIILELGRDQPLGGPQP